MPTISSEITLNGRRCIHNGPQFANTLADNKATSYLCPLGMEPGKVWLLMTYADFFPIRNQPEFTLSWRASADANQNRLAKNFTVRKLYFNKTQRLFPGGEGDPNAVLLIELEDRRTLLNRFSDTDRLYINWRSYAQSELYLKETVKADGVTPHSWSEAVELLWNLMPALGNYPGLPYVPTGVPTNFAFHGENAWKSLHTLLHRLDCTTRFDPFAETFSIVRMGVFQQPPANLPDPPLFRSESDTFNNPALDAPEKIRVYFSTHREAYGQEKDTHREENWITTQGQYVEVATGVQGAIAGTTLQIHDDLFENYDETDAIDNQADMNARAAERVANWVQTNSVKRKRTIYQSIQPYLPGSEVKAVWWRNFGREEKCGGTVTEVIQYPGMVKPIAEMMKCGDDCEVTREGPLMPSDLGRRTYPNYPRLPNIVQVRCGGQGSCGSGSGVWGASDEGTITPNDDGYFGGVVKRFVGGTMTELEECWILFVDDYDDNLGQIEVSDNDYFYGRLSGKVTSEGITRPLYLARRGGDSCAVFYYATLRCDFCIDDTVYYLESDPQPRRIGCCDFGPDPAKIVEATPLLAGKVGQAGAGVLLVYDPPDTAGSGSGSGCGADPYDAEGNVNRDYIKVVDIDHVELTPIVNLRICDNDIVGERWYVTAPFSGRKKEVVLIEGTDCEGGSGSGSGCDLIDTTCGSGSCGSGA